MFLKILGFSVMVPACLCDAQVFHQPFWVFLWAYQDLCKIGCLQLKTKDLMIICICIFGTRNSLCWVWITYVVNMIWILRIFFRNMRNDDLPLWRICCDQNGLCRSSWGNYNWWMSFWHSSMRNEPTFQGVGSIIKGLEDGLP